MNEDELNEKIEGAFSNIEPKTDAEREKLAKLRKMLSDSSARIHAGLEKARNDLNSGKDSSGELSRVIEERTNIATEIKSLLKNTFEEQAALIDRIALRGHWPR